MSSQLFTSEFNLIESIKERVVNIYWFWICRFSTLSACIKNPIYTKIFILLQETKIQKYFAGSPACFTSAFRWGKVIFFKTIALKSQFGNGKYHLGLTKWNFELFMHSIAAWPFKKWRLQYNSGLRKNFTRLTTTSVEIASN